MLDIPSKAPLLTHSARVSSKSPLAITEMASPDASQRERTASVDSLETIDVHYSPGEDPYWTELIAEHVQEQDSETTNHKEDEVEADGDKNEHQDADSELLPFVLDDVVHGQGQEAEWERWPSLPSPDAVMAHREAEALVQEFRGLSMSGASGEPSSSIDVSILQKYRHGRGDMNMDAEEQAAVGKGKEDGYDFGLEDRTEREGNRRESIKSARAQLLRDSEAIARLLQHQNTRHSSDDNDGLPPPHPDARHFLWQTSLLQALPPSPPATDPLHPAVLADPLLTNLWVRKEMQGRWTHKYHASLATERAALKARSHRAKLNGDEGEQEAVASAKRKLHRKVVADCMREALSEIDAALRTQLREPFADIERSAAEWKGLQCLALREHFTVAEAWEVLEGREEVLAAVVQDVMPDLEDRLEAVSKLLGVAEEEMRKMRTRYARLCAWDVRDPGERKVEMERRMGRPEALVYLLKGWEDVMMVREMAWAVVERFEDMESGLGDLAGVGMECGRAAEAGWLLGEVEGEEGLGRL